LVILRIIESAHYISSFVASTMRAIALRDGPVLLVGHSYGGAVITEAGNDPKVTGLVYVAAFAPDAGQAAAISAKSFRHHRTLVSSGLMPSALYL
jgi:pimeloyl-ACP methyl ester carboxylesterase